MARDRGGVMFLAAGRADDEAAALADADEVDALNDETFGASGTDWDMEQMSEQSALLDVSLDSSRDDGQQQELWMQAMLEANLSNLLEDDDDDDVAAPDAQSVPMPTAFGDAAPLFQKPARAKHEEARSTGRTREEVEAPSSSAQLPPAEDLSDDQPIRSLLQRLQVNGRQEAAPAMVRGALTAEQLESEMRSTAPARPLTLDEVEHKLRAASRLNNGAHQLAAQPPPPPPPPPPMQAVGVAAPRPPLMPTVSAAPAGAPTAVPPWLLNPQIRNGLMALISAGKPLPPGFPPTAVVAMMLRHPAFAPRPLAPPLMRGLPMPVGQPMQWRAGMPVRPVAYLGGQRMNGAPPPFAHFPPPQPFDPYADLLSRREREWLIKIMQMQLQGTGNPYLDDYYGTMMRNREFAMQRAQQGKGGSAELFFDTDSSCTPYVYMPPIFDGSLGKPTLSTASGPRQLIEMMGSSRERTTSLSDTAASVGQSSRGSPSCASTASLRQSSLRRLKLDLLSVEDMWTAVLDCEDRQRQAAADTARRPDYERTSTEATEAICRAFPLLCALRKGRALLARALGVVHKSFTTRLMVQLANHLEILAKRDASGEVYEGLFPASVSAAKRLTKEQLRALLDALPPPLSPLARSTKFANNYILLLLCHCARRKVEPATCEAVRAWALDTASGAPLPPPDWLTDEHLDALCLWLRGVGVTQTVTARLDACLGAAP